MFVCPPSYVQVKKGKQQGLKLPWKVYKYWIQNVWNLCLCTTSCKRNNKKEITKYFNLLNAPKETCIEQFIFFINNTSKSTLLEKIFFLLNV